jgi:hypothetical protein
MDNTARAIHQAHSKAAHGKLEVLEAELQADWAHGQKFAKGTSSSSSSRHGLSWSTAGGRLQQPKGQSSSSHRKHPGCPDQGLERHTIAYDYGIEC